MISQAVWLCFCFLLSHWDGDGEASCSPFWINALPALRFRRSAPLSRNSCELEQRANRYFTADYVLRRCHFRSMLMRGGNAISHSEQ